MRGERARYLSLVDGANSEGWLLHRIPDGPYGGKRPWDIGGAAPDGRAVGLEVKAAPPPHPSAPIPWRLFAQHQRAWLWALANKGGLALVALVHPNGAAVYVVPAGRWESTPSSDLVQVDLDTHFRGWEPLLKSGPIPAEG